MRMFRRIVVQSLSFEDQLRYRLKPYLEAKLIEDWIFRMQEQLKIIRRDPNWWPKGELDYKLFILELVSDVIAVNRAMQKGKEVISQ